MSLGNFWPDSLVALGPLRKPPPSPQTPRLTADVEQVREEEGLLVEVLYGEDNGAVEAAPQGLLGAALVCDERFEHGSHHVQLEKERRAG